MKIRVGDRYIGQSIIVQVTGILSGKLCVGSNKIIQYALVNAQNNTMADLYAEKQSDFIKLLASQQCFFVSRKKDRDDNDEPDVE